ncbi:MAG TPA: YcaO-like family protein, partial [Polyangiales bacterium]
DGDREFFEHARNRDRVESMRRCIDVPLDRARSLGSVPTRNFGSIAEDVRFEVERLGAVGLSQVLVADLSLDEIGIPVVRVIVPGLESISSAPGYVPGPRALRVTQS